MKKWFVFLFFLILLFFPITVKGQEQTERWVCLNAIHCWDKKPESADCKIKGGHRARLTTDSEAKPLPNSETYVVECIATPNAQICTTGNSDTDNIVYKKNNLETLKAVVDYTFEGFFQDDGKTPALNPTQSDAAGNIGPFIWGDSTPKGYERKWLALNYWTPSPTGSPGEGLGALQQDDLDFDFTTAEKDCLSIRWDPYGRVFDSQSLEPVMGVAVRLLKKRDDGSFTTVTTADIVGGNIINPQVVTEDGMFSFVVPDGTYKLTASKAGYIFPINDLTNLHPNYSKIYWDIYPAATGEEIVQAGSIQHRDIAVKATGALTNNPPKIMEYFYEARPITKKIVVEGRVSHPFTSLTFYSLKPSETDPAMTVRYRELTKITADKLGKFKVEIDQGSFEPTETFGELTMTKTDLTLLTGKQNKIWQKVISFFNQLIKKVQAQGIQSTTIKFDPILTYIEGYAYDSNAQVIANALVGVYLKFSNRPFYQTKADEKGYFKISSEHLPTMPYELRYTDLNGKVIKTSTTQFISQNKDYLAKEKTNLYVYKDDKGKEYTKDSIKTTDKIIQTQTPTNRVGQTDQNQTSKTPNNNLPLMIATLVFLLLAVVVILVIYLIKKKQSEMGSPSTYSS